MEVTRYHKEIKLKCQPWESIFSHYEKSRKYIEPYFTLKYIDSSYDIKTRDEMTDVLRTKGEPEFYDGFFWVADPSIGISSNLNHVLCIKCSNDACEILVEGATFETINDCFGLIAQTFGLKYCNKNETPKSLNEKIAFIAHAFDAKGNMYASIVSDFLDAVGFEVLTGDKYSPKGISKKVKERISEAKIVISIVTPKDNLTWLIQEQSISSGNIPLIALVEDGVEWNPGIHGDLVSRPKSFEHIPGNSFSA
jgi:hypothetical protein